MQKLYEKLLRTSDKEIIKEFRNKYKRLDKELKRIYELYEKNGQLDMNELRKYKRNQKLENDVAKILLNSNSLIQRELDKLLKTTTDNVKRWMYEDLLKPKGVNPIKKDLSYIKDLKVFDRSWKERYKHHTNNEIWNIQNTIKEGIERGDTYTTVAKTLREKLGKEVSKPLTIARTESHRVMETSKFETMKEVSKSMEVYKVWNTVKDEAVRSSHQPMEGVRVKIDEDFLLPSGATCLYPTQTGVPGEDINCRCFISYEFEKKDSSDNDVVNDNDLGYNKNELNMLKSSNENIKYYSKVSEKDFMEITKDFRTKGGEIRQDKEAEAYLDMKDADGATLSKDLILLRADVSYTELFEEVVHAEQYINNVVSSDNIIQLEIDAKIEVLDRIKKYDNIPDIEIKDLEMNLQDYINHKKRADENESR